VAALISDSAAYQIRPYSGVYSTVMNAFDWLICRLI